MAEYVATVRNRCADQAPSFLEFDSVCAPPIDFDFALLKAREGLQDKLEALVRDGTSVTGVTSELADATVVTLSFLTLQLHARAGQLFWNAVDEQALAAYLVYRLADIYADVLTKVEADGFNPRYCRHALEWLSSEQCCDTFTDQVLELIAFIREQRVGKSDAWIPNEEALADVMRRFSERRATGGLSHDLNRTRLIWLAVASGVVAILAVVSLRAVWNRK